MPPCKLMTPIYIRSGYHNQLYYPRQVVNKAKENLLAWPTEFDTIVGTGISGSMLLIDMARALKCNWLIIRKPNDLSHSKYRGEGRLGCKWIFVDDFIGSGKTFRNVYKEVYKLAYQYEHTTELMGAYLYDKGEVVSVEELRELSPMPIVQKFK